MKQVVFVVMLLASVFADAAEDFAVWENQTFSAPTGDGIIAASDPISNSSGNESLRITFKVHGLLPDRCTQAADFKVKFEIQEEVAQNVWVAIAENEQEVNSTCNAPIRVLDYNPRVIIDSGHDIPLTGVRITPVAGVAPSKFRLAVIVNHANVSHPLQSITLSAYGRKY